MVTFRYFHRFPICFQSRTHSYSSLDLGDGELKPSTEGAAKVHTSLSLRETLLSPIFIREATAWCLWPKVIRAVLSSDGFLARGAGQTARADLACAFKSIAKSWRENTIARWVKATMSWNCERNYNFACLFPRNQTESEGKAALASTHYFFSFFMAQNVRWK